MIIENLGPQQPPQPQTAKPVTLHIDECFSLDRHLTRSIQTCDFEGKDELIGQIESYRAERRSVLDRITAAENAALERLDFSKIDGAFKAELSLYDLAQSLLFALANGYERAKAKVDTDKAAQVGMPDKVRAKLEAELVAGGAKPGVHLNTFILGHPRYLAEKQKVEYFHSGLKGFFEPFYPDRARATANAMPEYKRERIRLKMTTNK